MTAVWFSFWRYRPGLFCGIAPNGITVVLGYVRVGDSPGYRWSVGRPEEGHHHRRPSDHQARAGILFLCGGPRRGGALVCGSREEQRRSVRVHG